MSDDLLKQVTQIRLPRHWLRQTDTGRWEAWRYDGGVLIAGRWVTMQIAVTERIQIYPDTFPTPDGAWSAIREADALPS